MRGVIKWMRQFHSQMITLTATLSRSVETLMMTIFLWKRGDVRFIRASVDRPNLSIQVVPVSATDLIPHAISLVRAVNSALGPDERCVVFFNDVTSL